VTGALWAAASGIGFGLFQSLNRRALRDIDDPFVSTFLQLAVAAVVLTAACVATGEAAQLADAPAAAVALFAGSGIVHFLLGWTFLNMSQKRVGAARTAPLLTFSPLFGLPAIARGALAFKLVAALLVAFATWWRWIALEDAAVGVVLALGLLSVPVVLVVAPLLVGGHLEHVTLRIWTGAALVVGGALTLIAVG
jgi:EamA-like transporter family